MPSPPATPTPDFPHTAFANRTSRFTVSDFGTGACLWLLVLAVLALICGFLLSAALSASASPSLLPALFLPHALATWLYVRRGRKAALISAAGACVALALAVGAAAAPAAVMAEPVRLLLSLLAWIASAMATPLLLSSLSNEAAPLRRALAASDAAGAHWDLRSRRVMLSRGWQRMIGADAKSAKAAVRTPGFLWREVHRDDRRALLAALRTLLAMPSAAGHPPVRTELRLRALDDSWRWLELTLMVAARRWSGRPRRLVAAARDVTDQHLRRHQQQVATTLFEHLHDGILVTDATHRVLDANPAYLAIMGCMRDDVVGRIARPLQPAAFGSAAQRLHDAITASLDVVGIWRGEIVDRRHDGEPCTLRLTISVVPAPEGQASSHVMVVSDITQALQHREQLLRQSQFDGLTGLPNRAQLSRMLRGAMQSSERGGFLLTVCMLDLDHFKRVNDQHGEAVGDRLLVELAQRLRSSLRHWASGDDAVARLNGDEFVLLLRTATAEEGRHAVQRVLRSLSRPYTIDGDPQPIVLSTTATIGATIYPVDRADADTLLRHADHAMYGAKQAGRNGYAFFDHENDRRTEERFTALGKVQDAFDAEQFTLYYQPKVDMLNHRVLGMEALLRWNHPQRGLTSPSDFLPLIEHTGLSASVGDWVLRKGIAQIAAWRDAGLDLSVSVNISARHLQEPQFAKRLADLLAPHDDWVAEHLIIEVLETAALADVSYTSTLMNECRALGVRFALDDFGTGYSTFTYLKRLPLDLLKIDRSFVRNMLDDRQDLAIVEGVIGLSQNFGCTVVAEGVESAALARRLIELGCTIGQGNGIAAAMPAPAVPGWVRDWRGSMSPVENVPVAAAP